MNVPMRGPGGAAPASIDDIIALHAAIESAFLAAEVVPYSPEVKAAIERCLTFRRAHNRRIMAGHGQPGSGSCQVADHELRFKPSA